MIKVGVQFLKDNMVVGRNIYDIDGKILLSAGVSLKENYIERLKVKGISEIYISTEETAEIVINDVVREQNRNHAQKIVSEMMTKLPLENQIRAKEISQTVNALIDDLLNNRDIMIQLSDIRAVDDYTFGHSVNVCVLSLITGIALGYNQLRLKELGVGALLHDIGKMWIPEKILNKPSFLTKEEFEEIKKHSELGYDLLKKAPEISATSSLVALTHHERYDGTGYPLGKKGEEIHEFSRIVAIADVYDALTSDRVYKQKVFPHQAIEYLTSMGNHQFDYEIVKKFIKYIAVYPVGTVIKLSTGEKGIILDVDRNFIMRPKVRVFYDPSGNRYDLHKDLDLKLHPSVVIVEILENIEAV